MGNHCCGGVLYCTCCAVITIEVIVLWISVISHRITNLIRCERRWVCVTKFSQQPAQPIYDGGTAQWSPINTEPIPAIGGGPVEHAEKIRKHARDLE